MEIGRFALALVGHFLASLLYVLQRLHLVETVVDTSSILEHREELRELWEKRMMADENQSSSPSTVAETNKLKPLPEEDNEEKVVKTESEVNHQNKIQNGFVKQMSPDSPDSNANHIQDSNKNQVVESQNMDVDHENNNNSADSLEEDNTDEFVEQKTYTSNLEQALVMTPQQTEEKSATEREMNVTTEEIITVTQEPEKIEIKETITTKEVQNSEAEPFTESLEAKEVQNSDMPPQNIEEKAEQIEENCPVVEKEVEHEESIEEKEKESVKEKEEEPTQEVLVHEETNNVPEIVEETVIQESQETFESLTEKMVPLEIKDDEDDDGFVRVEECLPKDDNDEPLDLPEEHFEQHEEQDLPTSNGFEEPHLPISPTESTSSDKISHPEMEQFVKSGGVKRIIPGVQKTEQPYNTCTTETKIAMEIREMREREEELRIMREQALLSPVVSPVPPKTPSISSPSPSPSPKEGPSPVPQGPGYRVSSVFGHKGTISPSPLVEEEKKSFKSFNKETAVEREIRLAREREEELRNQKGLPPREDDSYVKPSQVKSSQVRVFGKMSGTNNNSVKQAATAKIQMEIEEQTQREMALRETGHIQTISQERTDSKVAKLKPAESAIHAQTNGNSHSPITNGRASPDTAPYKRSSPSPTNARPASIFSQNNNASKGSISMHKFIASKGKETTFSAPRNGPFQPKDEGISRSAVPPTMVKLKRTVSVESKIQQEILEMKQREEELRKMHMKMANGNSALEENDDELEMNQNNVEYTNGNGTREMNEEEISPRHNKLIAQWEQRIQRAES